MKRTRTEIIVETERMLFISSPRKVTGWCATCAAQSEMVPVDEELVHSSENANGLLLICLNSLP
jgi:hypothetical protein